MENNFVFYPGEMIVDFPMKPEAVPQKEGYEFRDSFWGFESPKDFEISGPVKIRLLKIPEKGLFCGQVANGSIFSRRIRSSFLSYSHMAHLIYSRACGKVYSPSEWKNGIEILFPNSYWSSATLLVYKYAICSIKLLDGIFQEINKWSSELVNPKETFIAVSFEKFSKLIQSSKSN